MPAICEELTYSGEFVRTHLNDYVVLDLETTGLGASSGIIEIGAARIRGGKIVDEYSQLVNPQMPLPNGISALTGITNKMLADKPPIDDIISGFMNFIGNDVLIGHNLASFDLRVLSDTCFTHYGLMLENNYSDTLILAKCNDTLNSVLPNFKLDTLCQYYNIENAKAHRALSDAEATHCIYQKLFVDNESHDDFVYVPAPKSNIFFGEVKYSDKTKRLQELNDLLADIVEDNVVSESEARQLWEWLENNKDLKGNFPYDTLYAETEKCVKEHFENNEPISIAQAKYLLGVLLYAIDPVKNASNAPGRERQNNELDFNGKLICLTGDFDIGTKRDFMDILTPLGAQFHDRVVAKIDYLVVGGSGSGAWAGGNYGTKIKKALENQQKGLKVRIISEHEVFEYLKSIGAVK